MKSKKTGQGAKRLPYPVIATSDVDPRRKRAKLLPPRPGLLLRSLSRSNFLSRRTYFRAGAKKPPPALYTAAAKREGGIRSRRRGGNIEQDFEMRRLATGFLPFRRSYPTGRRKERRRKGRRYPITRSGCPCLRRGQRPGTRIKALKGRRSIRSSVTGSYRHYRYYCRLRLGLLLAGLPENS